MTLSDPIQPAKFAIGIDVGGTKTAAGLVRFPEGRVLARRWQPTRPERGGEAVLADVVDLARSLQNEGSGSGAQPVAIGLGVAELVGLDGEVLSDATIHWKGLRAREVLAAEIQLPVVLDADVRAAALGEAQLGSGRDFESFLYITIGTGISASLVLNGKPYAGARGLTGTFASSRSLIPGDNGELVLGPALEEYAAGPALAKRYAALRHDFAGSAPDVIALGQEGDPIAQNIVATAAQAVGAAIGNLVNVLDPAGVVIGGGLGTADGFYRESLESTLREQVWSDIHRDILVRSGELGNDAGFIGAALAAVSRTQFGRTC